MHNFWKYTSQNTSSVLLPDVPMVVLSIPSPLRLNGHKPVKKKLKSSGRGVYLTPLPTQVTLEA